MFNFAKFKKYLEDNGIKQSFIAEKIGVTTSKLNMIVTGRINCSLSNYVDICHVLKLPLGSFIDTEHTDENGATA